MKLIKNNIAPTIHDWYFVDDGKSKVVLTHDELDELVKTWDEYKWACKVANVSSKMGGQAPDEQETTIEDMIKWSKGPELERGDR